MLEEITFSVIKKKSNSCISSIISVFLESFFPLRLSELTLKQRVFHISHGFYCCGVSSVGVIISELVGRLFGQVNRACAWLRPKWFQLGPCSLYLGFSYSDTLANPLRRREVSRKQINKNTHRHKHRKRDWHTCALQGLRKVTHLSYEKVKSTIEIRLFGA